jgi:hypothetical protein
MALSWTGNRNPFALIVEDKVALTLTFKPHEHTQVVSVKRVNDFFLYCAKQTNFTLEVCNYSSSDYLSFSINDTKHCIHNKKLINLPFLKEYKIQFPDYGKWITCTVNNSYVGTHMDDGREHYIINDMDECTYTTGKKYPDELEIDGGHILHSFQRVACIKIRPIVIQLFEPRLHSTLLPCLHTCTQNYFNYENVNMYVNGKNGMIQKECPIVVDGYSKEANLCEECVRLNKKTMFGNQSNYYCQSIASC